MSKMIPLMPCCDMKAQVAFYEALGFEIVTVLTRPGAYAVVQYEDIEIQFYGSKGLLPADNPTMCYIRVDDVDAICKVFTDNLKVNTGRIPRSGFPKITKVRDLDADRRFTLSDAGGNTFYIGTPRQTGHEDFFRALSHAQYARKFAILYDLVYSKEDHALAQTVLDKLFHIYDELGDEDRAKLLLVKLEIELALNLPKDDAALRELLGRHEGAGDWKKIMDKYRDTVQREGMM